MVLKKTKHLLKTGTKNILDKTTIDDKLVTGIKTVKKEVRKNIITAISAAFAFLIALAWRDAIASWINTLIENFNLSEGWYKFVAALIVTIIGVIGIILVSRLEEKPVKTK
ncbi:MAG: DUF5654 family protein [Candidatus Woesearchaeota archaeon]